MPRGLQRPVLLPAVMGMGMGSTRRVVVAEDRRRVRRRFTGMGMDVRVSLRLELGWYLGNVRAEGGDFRRASSTEMLDDGVYL